MPLQLELREVAIRKGPALRPEHTLGGAVGISSIVFTDTESSILLIFYFDFHPILSPIKLGRT